MSKNYNAMQAKRDKQKADFQKIIGAVVRNCSICQVPSSKRRLYALPEGDVCVTCCNLAGVNAMEASEREAAYKAHLHAEANKPRPENYGEWA
jgi:RNA polymerase-binding transcription factor DksA